MAEAEAPPDRLTVDNYNWDIVKGDVSRLPLRLLTVIARDRPTTPLLVHEIADRVTNCEIVIRFVDTFYSANDPTWDVHRLRLLMSGRGLRIKVFYGHLNRAGLELLPRTVFELGLAIGNANDAETVSGMRTWSGLNEIRASVNPRVAVEDLRALPYVMQLGILFPGLTDARVSIVRQAITTLAPRKRLTVLYFPKSLLTAAGTQHLAETIRDMGDLFVDFEISIELCGSWLPDEEEKIRLREIIKHRVVMQKVSWNMSWIYEA